MTLDPQLFDLYDAIVSPLSWNSVGGLLSRVSGCEAAGLWIVRRGAVTDMTASAGILESVKPYLAYYHKLDVWQQHATRMPRNNVLLTCEHTPEAEIVRTEFYNDFARHYGLFRAIGAILTLSPGVHATISADPTYTRRLLDERDKPNFAKLLPVVRRALQVREQLQDLRDVASLKSAALDASRSGILACDAGGKVLFANMSARQMLRDDSGLCYRAMAIGACHKGEDAQLLALVRDAALGGMGGAIRLSRSDGTPNLLVHVAPSTPILGSLVDGGTLEGRHRAAIVLARPASDGEAFPIAVIMDLFGLTGAQAMIALQVHRGLSPEEIATQRGVKISTVRTQINAILRRTGSESLRDLTRLLARVPVLKCAGEIA